jgi:crotonobetainyl-CoA:carnitine CoA-transferase CaiB-like acyl-CoA transferase
MNMGITGYTLSGLLLWQLREKYPMGQGFGGLVKTKDGKYIRIASFSPRLIDDLREYLGVEEVTMEHINSKVSRMTRDEAVSYFVDARVPVAPIYDLDDVVKDPHLRERDIFTKVIHIKAGEIEVVNFPVKFSETPVKIEAAAPALGQHTQIILESILGYSTDKIKHLRNRGAI